MQLQAGRVRRPGADDAGQGHSEDPVSSFTSTIPTAYVLKTAAWIKRLAYLIALIGTVASYGTQVNLLLSYEVGNFSYVIPATIDMLAICAALALQLPGLDVTSRKIAGIILTVTVLVSVAANVTGGHNTIARLAHAWPVVAYLLGELLANRVRMYAARLRRSRGAAQQAAGSGGGTNLTGNAAARGRADRGPRIPRGCGDAPADITSAGVERQPE